MFDTSRINQTVRTSSHDSTKSAPEVTPASVTEQNKIESPIANSRAGQQSMGGPFLANTRAGRESMGSSSLANTQAGRESMGIKETGLLGEKGDPPKNEHFNLNFAPNIRVFSDILRTLPKFGNNVGDLYTYHFNDPKQTTVQYKWNFESGGSWTETVSDKATISGGSRTIRVTQISENMNQKDLDTKYGKIDNLPYKQVSLESSDKNISQLNLPQKSVTAEKKPFDDDVRTRFDNMLSGASLMSKDPTLSSEYRHRINLDPDVDNYKTILTKLNAFDVQEVILYINLPYGNAVGRGTGEIPFYNVGIDLLFEQEKQRITKDINTIKTDFEVKVVINRHRGVSLKSGYKIISK